MAKYHDYIRDAVRVGYEFDFEEQVIISPRGTHRKPSLYGRQRYPSLSINTFCLGYEKSKVVSFPFHKFVAYIIYGEESFKKGIEVRHLDNNVLNLEKENIVLGSSSENKLDIPKEIRSQRASHARSVQGRRPVTAHVTEQTAEQILREYLPQKMLRINKKVNRGFVKSISEKYQLKRSCVQSICSGNSFPDIYHRIIKELTKEENDRSKL